MIRHKKRVDVSNAVFDDYTKKADIDRPRGNLGAPPEHGIPAAVAKSTLQVNPLSNVNIHHLSPEIKRIFDENTKAHVRALYKWKRQGAAV